MLSEELNTTTHPPLPPIPHSTFKLSEELNTTHTTTHPPLPPIPYRAFKLSEELSTTHTTTHPPLPPIPHSTFKLSEELNTTHTTTHPPLPPIPYRAFKLSEELNTTHHPPLPLIHLSCQKSRTPPTPPITPPIPHRAFKLSEELKSALVLQLHASSGQEVVKRCMEEKMWLFMLVCLLCCREFEETYDTLQSEIDSLEQEKSELKERLRVLSKKTLLEGLTRQSSGHGGQHCHQVFCRDFFLTCCLLCRHFLQVYV